jgi:hypothetical protein
MKKVTNFAADNLDTFSSRIRSELPIYQKAFSSYLEFLSKVIVISQQDFNVDESAVAHLRVLASTLSRLAAQMASSIGSTIRFRQVLANLPRVTTRFNSAKRQAVQSLDEFVGAATEGHELATTIAAEVNRILGDSDNA